MLAKDIEPGTRVKNVNNGAKGTVIGNKVSNGPTFIAVEWADGDLGKIDVENVEILNTVYEQSFELIQAKLDLAGELLKEAATIADLHKIDILSSRWERDGLSADALMTGLDKCGWSTSSMSC